MGDSLDVREREQGAGRAAAPGRPSPPPLISDPRTVPGGAEASGSLWGVATPSTPALQAIRPSGGRAPGLAGAGQALLPHGKRDTAQDSA